MELPIRAIGPDEYPAFARANFHAFYDDPDEEGLALEREIMEWDRTWAAFDGERIVGTANIFTFQMGVPGGMVPMAGVSWVGVVPTHRRRGVLTALMRRQLDALHEGGESVATLWASESQIYGRFGYGMACRRADLEIEAHHVRLRPPVPEVALRMVEREEAAKLFKTVHDAAWPTTPGLISRSEAWWAMQLSDPKSHRHGAGRMFMVVTEAEGGISGFARYRVKDDWTEGLASNELRLLELMALDRDAYAALWNFVLRLDLVRTIKAYMRPVDEPLAWMVEDPRRLRAVIADGLWVRLVDVPRALGARRYAQAGRLVLEVEDEFCSWNRGRFELVAGPDGGECRRTSAEPDLRVDIAGLGAAYLGGVRLSLLAQARRLTELRKGAVQQADGMFGWHQPPWSSFVF